jgi:glycosyltransferase involved in cell wall biosynthesis
MTLRPLVTVIIPVYNTDKYLSKCINSVIDQTYSNLRIIIVNDGSTDNSSSIIDNFANIDNRIKVFSKENGGASSARNLGLENIEGDYVTFIDSDDWWELNAVEDLVSEAEISNCDLVMPQKFVKVYQSGVKKVENIFDISDISNDTLEFVNIIMIGKGRAWRVSSVLYKTCIINKYNIRFPNGYTAEDFVFNIEFLKKANRIGFLKISTLNVNKREGSVTSSYRSDLPELALYIDRIVEDYYIEKNINTNLSRLSRDSLLCRNIIIFLIFELSRINSKSRKEKNIRVENVLSNKRIKAAFGNRKFIHPYWNSKLKIAIVVFLRKLIHLEKQKTTIAIIKILTMSIIN